MSVRVLDCTLRDGGYYNKWDFSEELAKSYLAAMVDACVDYVELGTRRFSPDAYLGPHAFTTDTYLRRLGLPEGPCYGVMVDAKTVLSAQIEVGDAIDILFGNCEDELIDLVRVAAHFSEVESSIEIASHLKSKGYIVGLNIMQADSVPTGDLQRVSRLLDDNSHFIDVLYFADSLGSMTSDDISRVFGAIKYSWRGDVGFHAHNNTGAAIENALHAADLGCTWIDCTVTGMGRGAGNAETEYLLPRLRVEVRTAYESLFKLALGEFTPLRNHYKWGFSLPYYLGAQKALHPMYIQDLLSRGLDSSITLDVIDDLGELGTPGSYAADELNRVIAKKTNNDLAVLGDNTLPMFMGRDVIIVAQTDVSKRYQSAICDRAKIGGAVLLSLNYPKFTPTLEYDYVVVSHNERYRFDSEKYENSSFKYICPRALFQDVNINCEFNYGVKVTPGQFNVYSDHVEIPTNLTLAYAVGFALQAKARRIYLVGIAGYENDAARNKEMQELLSLMSSKEIGLISLTPTNFAIKESSIYDLCDK
jgi:4-hydroxy 2-oxovalerate aldolase